MSRSPRIEEADVWFTYSPSRGPGGQNVNKVATRATLHFNVAGCRKLDDAQCERIVVALARRIGSDGILRLSCDSHRTQSANRREALNRLRELMSAALRPVRPRRPTRATAASKERRREGKRLRSRIKEGRRRVRGVD